MLMVWCGFVLLIFATLMLFMSSCSDGKKMLIFLAVMASIVCLFSGVIERRGTHYNDMLRPMTIGISDSTLYAIPAGGTNGVKLSFDLDSTGALIVSTRPFVAQHVIPRQVVPPTVK